ncbi:hypothetical protein XELAEV_18044761mg, partial [Xenopus laevis]
MKRVWAHKENADEGKPTEVMELKPEEVHASVDFRHWFLVNVFFCLINVIFFLISFCLCFINVLFIPFFFF